MGSTVAKRGLACMSKFLPKITETTGRNVKLLGESPATECAGAMLTLCCLVQSHKLLWACALVLAHGGT